MSAWLPGVVTEHDGAAFYKLFGYRSLQTCGFPSTVPLKKNVLPKSFRANYLSATFLEDVFEDVAKHPSTGEASKMPRFVSSISVTFGATYSRFGYFFSMLLHSWLESVSMTASPQQSRPSSLDSSHTHTGHTSHF